MRQNRVLLIVAGVLLAGSIAIGAIWQSSDAGGSAPASRAIFPKVLNH